MTLLNYSDDTPDVSMSYVRGQIATVTDAAGVSTFTTGGATCGTEVAGGGRLSGLSLTRSEFGPDMPETVHAQVGGSTITLNQHQWNGDGTLAKAWQGGRSDGAGGTGIRHVWHRNPTTGRLEGIGTEAFGSGATHGIARSYTHTAGGRVKEIVHAGGALGTAGTSIQAFHYQHDAHGRRKTVAPYALDEPPTNTEDFPPGWAYDYNQRGEVTLADRFKGVDEDNDLPSDFVTHQRRSYDYDLMGNRKSAAQGTDLVAEDPVPITYTANILQQYDTITHTRLVEITGQAVAGAEVEIKVDGEAMAHVPSENTGDPGSFRHVHSMTGTEARWMHVEIKASVGTTHITRSGFTYVPPVSESLDYDFDGNLTSDGQWTYTWDAENRLTVAEQKSLPVASGFTAPARKKLEFAYDSKNRRIAKRVSHSAGSGWALTKDLRFVYDGWQMIAELDHTFAPFTSTGLVGSAVNRTFLWGPDLSGTMTGAGGVGGLLSTTYQGITYQVCGDANGNVTGLVPVSGTGSGTLVARFDYDPFGNRVTNAGPNVELCPFGFSSKYLDGETNLLGYELRWYASQHGKWCSRDRIAERGDVNIYRFCNNDGIDAFDYLGLATLRVTLLRTSKGYFGVYGVITAKLQTTAKDGEKFSCCASLLPLNFVSMESVGVNLTPKGEYTPDIRLDTSWLNGKSGAAGAGVLQGYNEEGKPVYVNGLTSIRGKLAVGYERDGFTPGEGRLPERPRDMSKADYDELIYLEFNMGHHGNNIHFGPSTNHSIGCALIGTTPIYVRAYFDEPRFSWDNKAPKGTVYQAPGFRLQDTIDSQFKLLRAAQCVKNKRGKVIFHVLNNAPKSPRGDAEHVPEGEPGVDGGFPRNF